MSRFIELSTWKRREHFELFRGLASPFFSVCVEVDATRLRDACHGADRPSFFLAALFLMLRAANETEAFRLRIRGGGVWVHDAVAATSTVLRADQTFAFARFEPSDSFEEFRRLGAAELEGAKAVKALTLPRPEEDGLIYHSTLPWMRFTAFSNALNGGADSIPRVVFGKCCLDGGRWLMPVAVEVHHALVDGIDVANFLNHFQMGLTETAHISPDGTEELGVDAAYSRR